LADVVPATQCAAVLTALSCANAGKTSVVRAMRSKSGTTEAIPLDERTIAIDVLSNWVVQEGDGLVLEVWDLGGQEKYHTSHSPYLSSRSLVVLVFRPTAEDGQYYTAGQLMDDFVLMWLRMLHVHVPSSRVVLVCLRWCSPPKGEALEQHQSRVAELCAEVEKAVAAELEDLNKRTQSELGHLRGQEEEVAKTIAAEEERIKHRGSNGDDEGGGHGRPGKSGEPQDLEHLRSLAAQLHKRRRAVTSESAAGSERDALAVTMELADGRVHCVECVGGDGRSALELRRVLVKCARALPFMLQVCPAYIPERVVSRLAAAAPSLHKCSLSAARGTMSQS
jgi:GTPase SAR1 family protein